MNTTCINCAASLSLARMSQDIMCFCAISLNLNGGNMYMRALEPFQRPSPNRSVAWHSICKPTHTTLCTSFLHVLANSRAELEETVAHCVIRLGALMAQGMLGCRSSLAVPPYTLVVC